MRAIIIVLAHMTGRKGWISVRRRDAAPNSARHRTIHSETAETEERSRAITPQDDLKMTIDLESLSFGSYVRLCVLISVCIGLVVSAAFFFLDVLGWDTTFHWGFISGADNVSGIIVLFVGPFVFGVTGFIGSLFTYPLFLWALRKFWGLSLTGTWK
jgi:hypothetical protein